MRNQLAHSALRWWPSRGLGSFPALQFLKSLDRFQFGVGDDDKDLVAVVVVFGADEDEAKRELQDRKAQVRHILELQLCLKHPNPKFLCEHNLLEAKGSLWLASMSFWQRLVALKKFDRSKLEAQLHISFRTHALQEIFGIRFFRF